MDTINTPLGLEKLAEGQSRQQSNDPAVKTENSEAGRKKTGLKWTDCFDKRFERLLVTSYLGKDKFNSHIFECLCDCGAKTNVSATSLNGGKTKSCGCLNRENISARNRISKRKHGHWSGGKPSKMVNTYYCMLDRCYGKAPKMQKYRERGITVCDRWRFGQHGKTGFECFIEDIQPPDDKSLSFDRINNDLGYFKENCRWATAYTQCNNTSGNRRMEHNGVSMTASQWERHLGLSNGTILHRLKSGWSVEDAITKKSQKFGKRT